MLGDYQRINIESHFQPVDSDQESTKKLSVMLSRSTKKYLLIGTCVLGVLYLVWHGTGTGKSCPKGAQSSRDVAMLGEDGTLYEYNRQSPMIFIGGVPRSGTTLMRAMLDAHKDVRCGEETRVVPRLLQMRSHWMKSQKESLRLEEAGLTHDVLDSAISSFILEVVARHAEPAPRLCNKDPFTLKSGTYLNQLFPKSKFLFMVRDGRATVHSIITRKVTITGFDLKSYKQCLTKWNAAISAMNDQCKELGPNHCMPVYYEQLVLHPQNWMRKILKFLELPWDDGVMHHEKHINEKGGVSLSKVERSSDQVIKPVNLDALSKWVGKMPDDVVKDMASIAPMLAHFGYDPEENPPNYGKPDQFVVDNTNDIKAHDEEWEEIAEKVKQLSKKDTAPRGKGEDSKDFDQ